MSPATIHQDIEMGLRPVFKSSIQSRGRGRWGEIAIHSMAYIKTHVSEWVAYAFSRMHPVLDDGDADAVIVTIDGEEGENESTIMCS